MTLNALKLRVEQKDLVQPWTRVLHALADEHVVILQEIPANEKLLKSRITFALEKLNEKRSTDNSTWSYTEQPMVLLLTDLKRSTRCLTATP